MQQSPGAGLPQMPPCLLLPSFSFYLLPPHSSPLLRFLAWPRLQSRCVPLSIEDPRLYFDRGGGEDGAQPGEEEGGGGPGGAELGAGLAPQLAGIDPANLRNPPVQPALAAQVGSGVEGGWECFTGGCIVGQGRMGPGGDAGWACGVNAIMCACPERPKRGHSTGSIYMQAHMSMCSMCTCGVVCMPFKPAAHMPPLFLLPLAPPLAWQVVLDQNLQNQAPK